MNSGPDMPLKGCCAIITGASQGLGAEIASQFVAEGASVMLCARDESGLEAVRVRLASGAAPGQQVLAMRCDMAQPANIEALVRSCHQHFPRIDILLNNAGIQGPMGSVEETDWTQWVATIQVNLLGVVSACRAVIPAMKAQGRGKIINISGGGATNPMPGMTAYAASKAANVRFTETLALELKSYGIDVNSVAPGALATRMLSEVLAAGPEKVGEAYFKKVQGFVASGGMSMAAAARCCVWLASSASDGITGKLVAAQWDPYEQFPAHAAELEGDIYTLRRIVPKDRGKTWGND